MNVTVNKIQKTEDLIILPVEPNQRITRKEKRQTDSAENLPPIPSISLLNSYIINSEKIVGQADLGVIPTYVIIQTILIFCTVIIKTNNNNNNNINGNNDNNNNSLKICLSFLGVFL